MAKWFVKTDAGENGPFTSVQIRDLARNRQITPETTIRRDDMVNWVKASSISNLWTGQVAPASPAVTWPTSSGPILPDLDPAKPLFKDDPPPRSASLPASVVAPEPRAVAGVNRRARASRRPTKPEGCTRSSLPWLSISIVGGAVAVLGICIALLIGAMGGSKRTDTKDVAVLEPAPVIQPNTTTPADAPKLVPSAEKVVGPSIPTVSHTLSQRSLGIISGGSLCQVPANRGMSYVICLLEKPLDDLDLVRTLRLLQQDRPAIRPLYYGTEGRIDVPGAPSELRRIHFEGLDQPNLAPITAIAFIVIDGSEVPGSTLMGQLSLNGQGYDDIIALCWQAPTSSHTLASVPRQSASRTYPTRTTPPPVPTRVPTGATPTRTPSRTATPTPPAPKVLPPELVWADEQQVLLPAKAVTGAIGANGALWVFRDAEARFHVVDTLAGKLLSSWQALRPEALWAVGGERTVFYSEAAKCFEIYDLRTGALQRKFLHRFDGPVTALAMGCAEGDRIFVLQSTKNTARIPPLVWLDLVKDTVIATSSLPDSGCDSLHGMVASPDASQVFFTRKGLSPSGLYWWRPVSGEPVHYEHNSCNTMFPGRHPAGLATDRGYWSLMEEHGRRQLTFTAHPDKLTLIPSLDGKLTLARTKTGICELHLHFSKVKLATIGVEPGMDGVSTKSPVIHSPMEATLDLANQVLFSGELGILGLVDQQDPTRVVLRRFNRARLLRETTDNFMLVTSAPPNRATAGEDFTYQIEALGKGGFTCERVAGPDGLAVTRDGKVTWRPRRSLEQVGDHSVSIRLTNGSGLDMLYDFTLTVPLTILGTEGIAAGLLQLGGSSVVTLGWPECGIHRWLPDGSSVIVSNKQGWLLGPSLLTGTGPHPMEYSYCDLLYDGKRLIGVRAEAIDMLDPKSFRVTSSIASPSVSLVTATFDRTNGCLWATARDANIDDPVRRQRIVRIPLDSGKAKVMEHSLAGNLALHPSGRILYGWLKAEYHDSQTVVDHFGRYLGTRTITASDQVLVSYLIDGEELKTLSINSEPGRNPTDLMVLPSGAGVLYASGGGYRGKPDAFSGYTVPAFDPLDLTQPRMAYQVGAYPRSIAVHPKSGMVVSFNGEDLRSFDQATGKGLLAQPLKLALGDSFGWGRLAFDATGDRLRLQTTDVSWKGFSDTNKRNLVLIFCPTPVLGEATAGKQLCEVPIPSLAVLRERAASSGGRPELATPNGASETGFNRYGITVEPNDLTALAEKNARKMSPKDIAATSSKAVVVVSTDQGFGTGFFVGKKGLVLTCAHNLPANATKATIAWDAGRGKEKLEGKATLVAIDRENDLALMSLSVEGTLSVVHLDLTTVPEMGTEVVVIGNPGAGDTILAKTMTTGVVSSVDRKINDLSFVQTSASVNPGNSGGPIFDDHGNVFGVVVLKANIEGVAFAVSPSRIRAFIDKVLATNPK